MSLKKATAKEVNTETAKTESKDLPQKEFSEADFIVYWKKYIDILEKQHERMLASILRTCEPQLEGTRVSLTYSSAMMMEEVKKNQIAILNYLRSKLENYEIKFELSYNEEEAKNFIYTPQEKFTRLNELNPLLNQFKKKFDLDL